MNPKNFTTGYYVPYMGMGPDKLAEMTGFCHVLQGRIDELQNQNFKLGIDGRTARNKCLELEKRQSFLLVQIDSKNRLEKELGAKITAYEKKELKLLEELDKKNQLIELLQDQVVQLVRDKIELATTNSVFIKNIEKMAREEYQV